jgi:hypothetical protein
MTGAAAPVFVLAAPRSMSSVVCAMLGAHPQMYGLPETHLFRQDTVAEWLRTAASETFPMADGLLRAVAEICYGEQTESTIRSAAGWVRRRSLHTSGMLFEELTQKVCPQRMVDKSPNMVYLVDNMQRVRTFFPDAKYIHLVRHPRAYCASVMAYLATLTKPMPGDRGVPRAAPHWIHHLAFFPYPGDGPVAAAQPRADPQGSWYVLNSNVSQFLSLLPEQQWIRVRAEDLVSAPAVSMTNVAGWLGLNVDRQSIRSTLHPERSPFARIGPPGARLGNDLLFLQRPALRPNRGTPQNLDDPLEWRTAGAGFLPEVEALARDFGYR